jgi:hypothetical protein
LAEIPAVDRIVSTFHSTVIVYGGAKLLFAAEVSLGRLDAHMFKKELNLFEFTACDVT